MEPLDLYKALAWVSACTVYHIKSTNIHTENKHYLANKDVKHFWKTIGSLPLIYFHLKNIVSPNAKECSCLQHRVMALEQVNDDQNISFIMTLFSA